MTVVSKIVIISMIIHVMSHYVSPPLKHTHLLDILRTKRLHYAKTFDKKI